MSGFELDFYTLKILSSGVEDRGGQEYMNDDIIWHFIA